ncbi:hypothetical protein RBG11_004282 [Vibrio parahaemolyticus]|nr:hypothetical protein [Vibrio parahaemolyticus]
MSHTNPENNRHNFKMGDTVKFKMGNYQGTFHVTEALALTHSDQHDGLILVTCIEPDDTKHFVEHCLDTNIKDEHGNPLDLDTVTGFQIVAPIEDLELVKRATANSSLN